MDSDSRIDAGSTADTLLSNKDSDPPINADLRLMADRPRNLTLPGSMANKQSSNMDSDPT